QSLRFRYRHGTSSVVNDFGVAIDNFSAVDLYPPGSIAGTVTDFATGDSLESVVVVAFDAVTTDEAGRDTTDALGAYEIAMLAPGDYDLTATLAGYVQGSADAVPVNPGETTVQDFALEAETQTVAVTGTVENADDPVMPVIGALVTMWAGDVEIASGVTDDFGAFDLGDQLVGFYDFTITYDPEGSTGFHNNSYYAVDVNDGTVPLAFDIFEILPPENLSAMSGDGLISLMWEPPLNHQPLDLLTNMANRRRNAVARTRNATDPADIAKREALQRELTRLEHHIAAIRASDDLDELDDFAGYIIAMRETDSADPFVNVDTVGTDEQAVTITGLTNDTDYTFRVAADYGYDPTYLAWSDSTVAAPFQINYSVQELPNFVWYDIRTTGLGTALGEGDDTTIPVALPATFYFYGIGYDQIYVGSNGACSFTDSYVTLSNAPIPSTSAPNALIAALWDDMDPGDSPDEDAWTYYDADDNVFIIEYNTGDFPGPGSNVKNFEVVLDFNNGSILLNYNTTQSGWPSATEATVGIENETGTVGTPYDVDLLHDGLSLLFSVPGGIEGTVSDNDGDPIEGASVAVFPAGDDVPLFGMTTGPDGMYGFSLPPGSYDILATAVGYMPGTVTDVEVFSNETTVVDITLPDESRTVDITGTVTSADNPGTPIEGATVRLHFADGSFVDAVTDAAGLYDLGDQLYGYYTFEVLSTPLGSMGFHDEAFGPIYVDDTVVPVDLEVLEIMPPVNVNATASGHAITVFWDPPLNHAGPDMLASMIEHRRAALRQLGDLGSLEAQPKIDLLRQDLTRLEALQRVAEARSEDDLNSMDDFAGYFVEMTVGGQSAIVDTTGPAEESSLIAPVIPGQIYTLRVAADYGYGEEYLVWSDPVDVQPREVGYTAEVLPAAEWVDVRNDPNATQLGLSDDGEALVTFTVPFVFYGMTYADITVGANGAASFIDTQIPYIPQPIPTPGPPDALIAPYWTDLNPSGDPDHDVWVLEDTTNHVFYVEWYSGLWGGATNIQNFEMVLDQTNSTIQFNYASAVEGWNTPASVGVEDELGLSATAIDQASITDNMSILLTPFVAEYGEVIGNVVECDFNTPVSGVAIFINDDEMPVYVTGDDGAFAFASPTGDLTLTLMHPLYWDLETDVTVTAGETTDLGTLTLTYPDGSTSVNSLSLDVPIDGDPPSASADFDLTSEGCGPMEWSAFVNVVSTVAEGEGSSGENGAGWQVQSSTRPQVRPQRGSLAATSSKSTTLAPFNRGDVGPVDMSTSDLDETWDLLYDMPMDDPYTFGVVSVPGFVFVGTWSGFYGLHMFDLDGNLIGDTPYPAAMIGDGGFGPIDLAYDENTGAFLGGNDNGDIFRFTPDMSVTDLITTIPGMWIFALTYDWDNGKIYAADGTNFVVYDEAQQTVMTLPVPAGIGMPNSMGYMPNDPDGYTIWAMFAPNSLGSIAYRYNPEFQVWDPTGITIHDGADGGMSGGMDINTAPRGGFYDITTLYQSDPDIVEVYEGIPAQEWLTLDMDGGVVESGETITLTLTADLEAADFEPEDGETMSAEIVFRGPHWMNPPTISVDLTFYLDAEEQDNLLPTKYALHQNYPNPFNPVTEIKFDLVKPQAVKLSVYNVLGQEVARVLDQRMEAGFHQVSFDASKLASGVYFYRIDTPAFTDLKKMVLVK
ncbi:MAG TPA: T9SS type A sorting domain-containing protein, partial [Bacteroidetes bacterium]|nr:T9SS type A sorting domain-containing protein [Bacteroidota bacterium]